MRAFLNNFLTKVKKIDEPATINMDGRTITGRSITITNDQIIIDGKEYNEEDLPKDRIINLSITGNVEKIETKSGTITVKGDVKEISSISGDINIEKNVNGDISSTSGDITVAGSVKGDVGTISGDTEYGT